MGKPAVEPLSCVATPAQGVDGGPERADLLAGPRARGARQAAAWTSAVVLVLGQIAGVALAGAVVAGERQPAQRRSPAPQETRHETRQETRHETWRKTGKEPRLDARALADRIDRREPGSSNKVMRFGDTEIRVGGRASFGYGYSGR
ncbi:hypothetical protein GCM10019059_18140 [Camelimonas fluminis]|uniref:Uncharacterized protein n=1 Tax=Camelimonas fluminis TaxID=1576911 RepID=A0ABV7UJE0_9HYPH|nr:hypothetical protein [Camelimonas fluminis]GHE58985.1 hypothetical protein GCM10019059_18140 [Camelimonas fluminis]